MLQYQEYLELGDEVGAALSFQDYYTIKYGSWPNDLDEDSLKGMGKKLKGDEQEGWKKKHAPSHVADVWNEVDKIIAFEPPLELSYEANDINTHDENE